MRNIKVASEYAENLVCPKYGVNPNKLRLKIRHTPLVEARHIIWYILNRDYNFSLMEIARHYGFHHTSIMNGVARAMESEMVIKDSGQLGDKSKKTGDKVGDSKGTANPKPRSS